MTNKFLRVLSALLIAVLLISSVAVADFDCTVYTSKMQVYQSASKSSKNLGSLSHGTKFTVVQVKGNWAKITLDGKTGFALVSDMKRVEGVPMYTKKQTKVYQKASDKANTICTITADYPVYMVGMSGNYYLVEDKDGHFEGYVLKSNLSNKRSYPNEVSSSSKKSYTKNTSTTDIPAKLKSSRFYLATNDSTDEYISYLLYVAQCKLGCQYKRNNANNKTTFSNLSLVTTVFKAVGINVGTSVTAIAHKGSYSFVAYKNLKRGDIVCFKCDASSSDAVDHLGIYIGSGYFIHCSATAGCVLVSYMGKGYYKENFCWGRRVLG